MDGYSFTQKTRSVLAAVKDEAQRLGHAKVATEHLLLALLNPDHTIAGEVLESFSVDVGSLRERVLALAPKAGSGPNADDEVPYSAAAKRVLEFAMKEAGELQHAYVGTEHLLLALMRESRGVAARALEAHGVTLGSIRAEVLRLVGPADSSASQQPDVSVLEAVVVLVDLGDGRVVARKFSTAQEAKDFWIAFLTVGQARTRDPTAA